MTVAILIIAVGLTALCGGPWRFMVRVFATLAAVAMALSSFCGLMDHASRMFIGMAVEAAKQGWREARANRRAALAEMGERA
jgi:hypothetical protein